MTGSEIIEMRKRHGWSQSDLADKLGVNQATVSRMEKGGKISRPVSKLLMQLALGRGGRSPAFQEGVAQ